VREDGEGQGRKVSVSGGSVWSRGRVRSRCATILPCAAANAALLHRLRRCRCVVLPRATCANANAPVAGRERGGVMERRGGGKGCATGVDEIRRGEGGQATVGGRGRAGCG
jgi:hypothetical protein